MLSCDDLTAALDYYTGELGFRLDVISPADAPRVAQMSGHGIQVRLEQDASANANERGAGRAGMQYRDLIPDRMGGRYIASNIRIEEAGPVPDYVHHHHVRFQMIYCSKGWVKVVYEDQGPPFVLQAGDCVLQPPHIRHRVLECSAGMEVVEVSGPAEHETFVDHDMTLPLASVAADRSFDGQRFVRHQAALAAWLPGPYAAFEYRDTGIADATDGLASAIVVRPLDTDVSTTLQNDGELFFLFVLQGEAKLQGESSTEQMAAGDSCVLQEGEQKMLSACADKLEFLLVTTQA